MIRRHYFSKTCLALTLLSMVLCFGVALADAPWAMVCANSARTNQSGWSGPGADIDIAWKVPTQHTPPHLRATVAENGTVFCQELGLFAYDNTGKLILERSLGQAFHNGTQVGLIDGDMVYAGLVNTLYGFDLQGREVGQYTVPDLSTDYYFVTPAMGASGEIILPMRRGSDGFWVDGAIDSIFLGGDPNWSLNLDSLTFPPAVSQGGEIVVCTEIERGFEIHTLLACLESDGSVRWQRTDVADGWPMIDNARNRILVRSLSDEYGGSAVMAFDMETGQDVWSFMPASIDPDYFDAFASGEWPLALDTNSGICYAFWQIYGENASWVLMAIGPDSEPVWSRKWQDDREKVFDLPDHAIIDVDGLIYIFYSFTRRELGIQQGVVCCVDVLDAAGALMQQKEYGGSETGFSWMGCNPAIGPDKRVYMFAQDFDHPVTCSLFAFGTDSGPAPEYRPTILSAGYGLSGITESDGGVLKINAEVYHPLGFSRVQSVEVWLNGDPTTYALLGTGTSGEFSLTVDVPAGFLQPGQFMLELIARDTDGKLSDVWPYLTVSP